MNGGRIAVCVLRIERHGDDLRIHVSINNDINDREAVRRFATTDLDLALDAVRAVARTTAEPPSPR